MDSVQVSWEKVLKSLDELQFFRLSKKCTFCIMYWLVNLDSKLKKMAQNLVIEIRHEAIWAIQK